MRTLLGHSSIHGERAKGGKKDQYQGGNWRERTGGKKSNAGLITKCREIVDTSQTHYFPPRILLVVSSVRGLTRFLESPEQPELKLSPCVLGKKTHRFG